MLDLFNATLRWVLIDRLKPKHFVPLPVSNWQVETRIRWFISGAMHFSPLRRDSLYGTLRHWAMMDLPSIEDTANNFAKRNRVAHPKLWLAPSPDIESLSLGPWGVPLWLIGRQSLTAESGFRDSANWGFSRRCIIWHTGVWFPLFTPIHYSMSSLLVPFIIFVWHWPFWEHVF